MQHSDTKLAGSNDAKKDFGVMEKSLFPAYYNLLWVKRIQAVGVRLIRECEFAPDLNQFLQRYFRYILTEKHS